MPPRPTLCHGCRAPMLGDGGHPWCPRCRERVAIQPIRDSAGRKRERLVGVECKAPHPDAGRRIEALRQQVVAAEGRAFRFRFPWEDGDERC